MKKILIIIIELIFCGFLSAQFPKFLSPKDTADGTGSINLVTVPYMNAHGGGPQYLYKTVYVDSAKIRDYFDTLLIVSPGVNKIIIIDQMDVMHNNLLNYNSMACFMLYNDTILGTYIPDVTPYNLINRTLFWETKAGGPAVSFYNQSIYTTVLPYSQRITCVQCPDMDNWVGVDDPSPWQISRSHYPNKGIRFLAGDFFYYNGVTHNATGRRVFKFTIKYHIETIN
jgi:hypothetical protein